MAGLVWVSQEIEPKKWVYVVHLVRDSGGGKDQEESQRSVSKLLLWEMGTNSALGLLKGTHKCSQKSVCRTARWAPISSGLSTLGTLGCQQHLGCICA